MLGLDNTETIAYEKVKVSLRNYCIIWLPNQTFRNPITSKNKQAKEAPLMSTTTKPYTPSDLNYCCISTLCFI